VVFRLDPAIPQAALNQAEAAQVSARANLGLSEALYEKAVNGNRPEEVKASEATVKRLQDEEEMARLNFGGSRRCSRAPPCPRTISTGRTPL